jgi:hypothetical protein
MRRNALNPFFSKAKVRSLQPLIEDVAHNLLSRFEGFKASGEHFTLSLAYAALTNGSYRSIQEQRVYCWEDLDIAEMYALGRNDSRVEAKDFDPSFHDASVVGSTMGHLTKQMPWILHLMQSLPDSAAVMMNPDMASYIKLQRVSGHISKTISGLTLPWLGHQSPDRDHSTASRKHDVQRSST